MKLLKTKAAKIAVAACAAMALFAVALAAVFFLRPGAGEVPATGTTAIESTTAALQGHAAQPELEGILSSEPAQVTLAQSTAAETTEAQLSTQPQQAPGQSSATQTTLNSTSGTQTTTKTSRTTSSTTKTSASTTTTTTQNSSTTTTTTAAPAQTQLTCTIAISCKTLLDNGKLDAAKVPYVPADGVILSTRTVTFSSGESVFDVLKRATRNAIPIIHMEFVEVPAYGSAYIEGIGNIYELDCGQLSGWMYKVNGVFPSYGCSDYKLRQGDAVEFLYTCDLGRDIGGGGVTGQRG